MKRSKQSGVYLIECKINGKVYIGAGKYIPARINCHKCELRLNRHNNKYMQDDYNKYGESNFHFRPLHYCPKKMLDLFERIAFKIYECTDRRFGYNMWSAGKKNRTPSDEVKEKIRKKLKGIDPVEARLKSYDSFRKKVINKDTGAVYASVVDASKFLQINESTLRGWLHNRGAKRLNVEFLN